MQLLVGAYHGWLTSIYCIYGSSMKIIQIDNFNRDNVADVLVADNIANQHYAALMLKALLDTTGSLNFFLVGDDYKLKEMED